MKLTLDYNNGTEDRNVPIAPSAETVLKAATKLGYQDMVADPDARRNIELKQIEVLKLDPNNPQRAVLGAELQAMQQSANTQVPNPMNAETFMVEHVRDYLVSLLVDEQTVQAEANAFAQSKVDEQKVAAAVALGLA